MTTTQPEPFPYGSWDTVRECWLKEDEYVILPSGEICKLVRSSVTGGHGDYYTTPTLENFYGKPTPSTTIVLRRKE